MQTTATTMTAQRCSLIVSVLGLTMVGLTPQSASAQAMALVASSGRAVVLQTFRAGQFVHLVIVPRAGKLSIAWKVEEGAGPTWSATQVIRGQRGRRHEVVYLHGFYEPEEDAADRLDVARLSWDDASARLREAALPARSRPLYRLDLGTYDTAAQARQARSANFCLSPYWVLDASRFRAGGKATIGMLYASRALAEKTASALKKCQPGATASVVTWTAAP
jgi:hypothetical protein